MEDIGGKIVVGAIGAIIALYLKYWYEQDQDCKRLNYISKTLVAILKGNILPQLELYIETCNSVKKDLQKNLNDLTNKGSDFSGLDIDFISYLGKDDIMKIFIKQRIDISLLIDLQFSLKRIVIYPPNAVTDNLISTLEKINKRHKDFISTTENKTYINNSEQTKITTTKKALDTAIDNLDLFIRFATKQIETINLLINKLP